MQMHKLKFTKPNSNEMEKFQVIDDYQQTDTLNDTFLQWIEALHHPAKKNSNKITQ